VETRSVLVMNWRDLGNPAAGGAEVYTHEVLKRIAARGHEVTLLTSGFRGGRHEEVLDGVRILRVGDRFSVYRRARRVYRDRFKARVGVVVDEINTRPFHTPRFVDDGASLFALIFQLAREFWFYETPFPVSVIGRYFLEERWLRAYREVPTFTISPSSRQDLIALGFRDVIVVPPGLSRIPLPAVPEKEERPTLAFVGRLKRAKLPDHALRAFARVRAQIPESRLWIVGDGYMRPKLEREAPEGVTFLGRTSEEKKFEVLRRAHLLLFPAVREGWGLTVLEANSQGTPAVGYDVPGLRDSIRARETGELVPAGNPEVLGDMAASLLVDVTARERMARNALAWASKFSWDRTAESFLRRIAGKV